MVEAKKINIEVAYALPEQQVIIPLQVNVGTTVIQAIELSGILEQFQDIDLQKNKFGVFDQKDDPGTDIRDKELRDKDRIGIYRPLIADPKESRRKRAEKKKAQAQDNK